MLLCARRSSNNHAITHDEGELPFCLLLTPTKLWFSFSALGHPCCQHESSISFTPNSLLLKSFGHTRIWRINILEKYYWKKFMSISMTCFSSFICMDELVTVSCCQPSLVKMWIFQTQNKKIKKVFCRRTSSLKCLKSWWSISSERIYIANMDLVGFQSICWSKKWKANLRLKLYHSYNLVNSLTDLPMCNYGRD